MLINIVNMFILFIMSNTISGIDCKVQSIIDFQILSDLRRFMVSLFVNFI